MTSRPRLTVAISTLGLALAACSHGGGSRGVAPTTPTSSESATAARTTHLLTIAKVNIERAGDKGAVNGATRSAVLSTAQRYVDRAILAPLVTGRLGRGYASVFAAGIRPAVTGPDQNTLTDLSIGRTSSLNESATPIALSGLADPSGALLYLAADFTVTITAIRAGGRAVTIRRNTELTFEPVGSSWLITAYRVTVKRSGPPPAKAQPRRKPTPTTRPRRTPATKA